jgi:hypothetical protein
VFSSTSHNQLIKYQFVRLFYGQNHRNLSIICIVQNIFHQGKEMRNISLNAHYIVLFKSPRDKQQISMLARQVYPGRVQELTRSYEHATSRPHGYLMLDLKPTTDDQQRLKTNILPGEADALRRISSPRTKLLAARCECLHLIKMNSLALWLDESAHACTRSEELRARTGNPPLASKQTLKTLCKNVNLIYMY